MRVGVPREVKNHEYRVALTPAGVTELVRAGHEVFVEQGAGEGSSIPDADFVAAGARIVADADDVWDADLLLKVKEPVAEEYHRLRAGQTLFTYLHLAASKECTDALVDVRHDGDRLRDRADRRTARCRCWRRCRRSPAGWPRRWARTAWSGRTAAAACCSAGCPACTPPRWSSSAPACPA